MPFTFANINSRASLVQDGHVYDLEAISKGDILADPLEAIAHIKRIDELAGELASFKPSQSVDEVEFLAPIPNPRQSYGVGLNYRNHAEEGGMAIPEVPLVFTKFPSCVAGPTSLVEMRSDYVDYEGELVVVVGREGADIGVGDAWDFVAGLCVGQDFSDRAVQLGGDNPQFSLGKSFATFGPIGPYIVSPDSLGDPTSLRLTTKVNGEVRQDDDTGDLIFDIPSLLSYLSHITPLFPGDLIFTGTPGGVGVASMNFLTDGDVVETSIEGLGTMQNRCVRVSNHPNADKVPGFIQKGLARKKEAARD